MFAGSDYYLDDYEESRSRFFALADQLKSSWPQVLTEKHLLEEDLKDLSIDIIKAPPRERAGRLLVITAGLHGIEGYTGAAMQHLFAQEFAPYLNPRDTGLVLVHAINPWGMKARRRVNEHNVDLNRNFIHPSIKKEQLVNPAYRRAVDVLEPGPPARARRTSFFYLALIKKIIAMGPALFRQAVLLGQYEYPLGLYYGGQGFERSTEILNELYHEILPRFDKVVLIDLHTGYGPRYNLTLVNSSFEKRPSKDLKLFYDYPLVVKAGGDEFYEMHGDMIDYLYLLTEKSFPDLHFYGTCFEFGTLGDSYLAVLKNLKTVIDENFYYHHGSGLDKKEAALRRAFEALFYPREAHWRRKALEEARKAFRGILKAEGYFS